MDSLFARYHIYTYTQVPGANKANDVLSVEVAYPYVGKGTPLWVAPVAEATVGSERSRKEERANFIGLLFLGI